MRLMRGSWRSEAEVVGVMIMTWMAFRWDLVSPFALMYL